MVDLEKVKNVIDCQGLNYAQVSREMGFGDGYLSNCFSRGNMPKYAVVAFCNALDIEEDDISVDEDDSDNYQLAFDTEDTLDNQKALQDILSELRTTNILLERILREFTE